MELKIKVIVIGRVATAEQVDYICSNSDYVLSFDFDEEWSKFEYKTARFIYNGKYVDVLFSGNKCPVPKISNTYSIKVGVYAGDLCTTTPAYIPAKKSILCGNPPPADPAPDVYHQIMAMLNDLAQATVSPEEIKQAVAAYLEANPIQESDPTVPDWAKAEEPPKYTAEDVGALSEDTLQNAIDVALQEAKDSGAFDGKNGSDASVTSENIVAALGYAPAPWQAVNTKVQHPTGDDGQIDYGTAGQFAVSDGNGGITWLSLTNVGEVGA